MILTAIKSAILRCTGVVVQEVFASTDSVAVEMVDLVNEVATDIMKSRDWRALTSVAEIVGTGVEAYDLPSGFDRMVLASDIDDKAQWFWGYEPFDTVNDWMRFKAGGGGISQPGGWIMLGGQLQFYPAPSGTAQFPYISNLYAKSASGTIKEAFTADTDTFRLNERLLTLGLIWRWKAQKGFEYAEDMATYETALAQEQGRDKGASVLRSVGRRMTGAGVAYSGMPIR
jgi:hypothetical protein